jgi:hypothetical protein
MRTAKPSGSNIANEQYGLQQTSRRVDIAVATPPR